MDHPLTYSHPLVRPWRTAAIIAGSVAAIELVLLIVLGGVLLAKPDSSRQPAHPSQPSVRAVPSAKTPVAKPSTSVKKPELPRKRVSVVVLNGNGIQGAAAGAAERVQRRGYRIESVANAPRMDYTRTLVMYRAGFAAEGQRLARDLGIRIVGPLDGLKPRQLHGAQAVVVVGS